MAKLLIRSADRESTSQTTHNFGVALRDMIKDGRYRLKNLQIYNTCYTITAGVNDKVYCSLGNKQLTPGYYSGGTAFATQLQTDLQTIDGSFAVAYSSSTGKLTFTCTNPFIFQWANSTGDDAARQLGFNLVNSASVTSLVSTNVINLIQSPSILVNIGEAEGMSYIRSTNASSDMLGTLRIPVDVAFGSILNYDGSKLHLHQIVNLRATRRLTVKLYDEQGRAYNLQGTDWSFELEELC